MRTDNNRVHLLFVIRHLHMWLAAHFLYIQYILYIFN
jgi:hypothetical protein